MAAVAKNDGGGIIKVGTTGTIGSLMTRELESMKHTPPASEASHRKTQTAPVSVPCGAGPKKIQPRRNPPNESGSSSSSGNGNVNHKSIGDVQKPRYTTQKSGHKVPMLSSESINLDKNARRGKPVGKKGSSYIVEVVDLKCSNPMSNRLRKLGFSKLSESVI